MRSRWKPFTGLATMLDADRDRRPWPAADMVKFRSIYYLVET
jgi:hypothetical protein